MISERLLNKLQVGKKYLITNGIGFYALDIREDNMFCSEIGWHSNGFFTIYPKSWQDVLDENVDDRDYHYDIKNNYDKTQPTYKYSAFMSKLFVSASTHFSTYDLYFLGEYKEDYNTEYFNKYCDIFKLNYKYKSKKERLKEIYSSRINLVTTK